MDPNTLTALQASIAHWRRMATGKAGKDEMPTGECCALCRMFPKCKGCPVAEKTGFSNCRKTPFLYASEAFFYEGKKVFRTAAVKELKFLESLLPKKTALNPKTNRGNGPRRLSA